MVLVEAANQATSRAATSFLVSGHRLYSPLVFKGSSLSMEPIFAISLLSICGIGVSLCLTYHRTRLKIDTGEYNSQQLFLCHVYLLDSLHSPHPTRSCSRQPECHPARETSHISRTFLESYTPISSRSVDTSVTIRVPS